MNDVNDEHAQKSADRSASILERLVSRFRRHKFIFSGSKSMVFMDGIAAEATYTYPHYRCQECGETLSLDEWQMKDLPREIQFGCEG